MGLSPRAGPWPSAGVDCFEQDGVRSAFPRTVTELFVERKVQIQRNSGPLSRGVNLGIYQKENAPAGPGAAGLVEGCWPLVGKAKANSAEPVSGEGGGAQLLPGFDSPFKN